MQQELLPITYTRTPAHIRLGIDTIGEKWQAMMPGNYFMEPATDYLREFFGMPPAHVLDDPAAVHVAANVLPDKALVAAVVALCPGS